MIYRRLWGRLALAAGVLLLLGAAAMVVFGLSQGNKSPLLLVPCEDMVTGCELPGSGLQVRFDQRPQPMKPFQLKVTIPDAHDVHASFAMRDMQMGLNRYHLLPDGAGAWKGEIILPICIHGRSDWLMTLEVDHKRYQLPFSSS